MLEVISYSKAEQIKFTESILKKKKEVYINIYLKRSYSGEYPDPVYLEM